MMLRYFIGLFRIKTADSAQPRAFNGTDPFPCVRVGSGHKTRKFYWGAQDVIGGSHTPAMNNL